MDKQNKHLSQLFKEKRFYQIDNISTDKMLKVDGNEVTKIIKKNYSFLDCTCESSGKTEHNSLCRHKQFFIIFPFLKLFNDELEKLMKFYKQQEEIKSSFDAIVFLNDLQRLKDVL